MYALLSTLLYRKALLVGSNFGKTKITADMKSVTVSSFMPVLDVVIVFFWILDKILVGGTSNFGSKNEKGI
jgi:hypothetical protein